MGFCLLDEGVDEIEVEMVFLWFDLFPVDRYFEGIGVKVFDGLPDLWQEGGPRA